MTKKLIAGCVLILSFLSFNTAFAQDVSGDGISKTELIESLRKNTNLSQEQIDGLIQVLQKQFDVKPEERIPIEGYLYSSGMNGALFVDHDVWNFDATMKVPGSQELVTIHDLYSCDFHNGGLKFEIAYKWMFTFIPRGVTVDQLDGAVYGRGIGVVADALLGLEGSWMPAKNRNHDVFHAAIKVGIGGGIIFPKMEFKLRPIR
ncbi:hypothetical protein [Bdellovibrio sp. HCB-162]|uniref:hypothetical protein n=1 Tax=Bdellovibrio sp. HCB-162 TaxID=3394234 RepID=UPI0039BD598C